MSAGPDLRVRGKPSEGQAPNYIASLKRKVNASPLPPTRRRRGSTGWRNCSPAALVLTLPFLPQPSATYPSECYNHRRRLRNAHGSTPAKCRGVGIGLTHPKPLTMLPIPPSWPWATGLPQMSLRDRRDEILQHRKECKPRPSSGEDATTGLSGSWPDFQTTADLSGLNVSHFCWLPTRVIASVT